MKTPVVLLAIVCAVLGAALYLKNSRAQKDADASAARLQTLSNQVAEVRTRLVLEQSNATVTQSNHQSALDRRAVELAAATNRLAQGQAQLAAAQAEIQRLHHELQSRTAELANLQAQRDELKQQVDRLSPLPDELGKAQERLVATEMKLNVLVTEWGALRVEHADLLHKLDDPKFLEIQLAKAREQAEWVRKMAKAKTATPKGMKSQLELLPDGTVRPAPLAQAGRAE